MSAIAQGNRSTWPESTLSLQLCSCMPVVTLSKTIAYNSGEVNLYCMLANREAQEG